MKYPGYYAPVTPLSSPDTTRRPTRAGRLIARLRARFKAESKHRFALLLAALLLAGSTIWFFAARDDHGRTARLTADAWYYHAYLPSLVLDRDLDFQNEYRITKNWYRFGNTELGRPANVFGIGPACFELPFFLVGHGLARLGGSRANGFSRPEVETSLYASLLFSLGALFFAWRLIRRRLGAPRRAALVPLLLACGGPVVYYAIRQPGYAHPFATFWVAWLIDAWDASYDGGNRPRSLKTWLGLGALMGLATLARPQLALWAVILLPAAVDDVLRQMRNRSADSTPAGAGLWHALSRSGPRWAAGAAVSLVLFAPQLLAWKALYGGYIVVPQGAGFMRWDAPAWSEVMFSSRNGLFPWAPLYALGAVGLFLALRRAARPAALLITGVAMQAVANGAVWDWWAGGSFGGRRFDSCFVAFAFGLAALAIPPGHRDAGTRWARMAAPAVLVIAALLALGNLQLASAYSAPDARIYGGQAAWRVLQKTIDGPVGPVVEAASRVANFPARALFALRYDRSLGAYDEIVGVHYLGELYPGLNSFQGKTHAAIPLKAGSARIKGAVPGTRPGSVKLTGDRVTILVGLNRFGPVTLTVNGSAPANQGTVAMFWNDRELTRQSAAARMSMQATAEEVLRGVNVLTIEAPAGTEITGLVITGARDPRSKAR